MYNDNNRKLRTILLVLAIVLVLLRIVQTAKADSLDDYYSQIKATYFDNISSSNVSAIESVISDWNLKYFLILKQSGTAGTFDKGGNVVLLFTDVDNIYLPHFVRYPAGTDSINLTYNSVGSLYTAYNNYSNVNVLLPYSDNPYTGTVHGLAIWQDYNGNPWCGKFTYDFNDGIASNYHYYSVGTMTSGNSNYSNAVTASNYLSCGNYYAFSPVTSGGSKAYLVSFFSTSSYSEDSRLKFWTFDNLDGSKTLVTSLDAFCVDSIFVQNEFSNIVLTYELDNIEHTVSLDSSNSVIRSTQNQNGGNITYKLETPFSVFGFDNSTVSFKITKCDFTYIKTTMGNVDSTAYKISCNYLAFSRFVPVEPAVIPSPAVSDPAVDSSVYTFINTVYGSYSSDRYGRSGTWDVSSTEPSDVSIFRSVDVYHFVNEEHGSGVDESIYYYSLLDWGNTVLDITAYTVFDWDKFLSENTSALYFDVISVPVYHFTPVGQSSTISGRVFDGYALFYTPSYFLRQQYGLLGDILTVVDQDAQNQYNNGIWLVDKINDFETKSLDVLNASLDIETDSLSWLKTIDNSLKSLDFPDFDDSSILSGLASIVSALSGDDDDLGVNGRLDKLINFFVANDAEPNESALTYRNWLDGLDPTETRRVTHFGSNIYSLVKNIFDLFDADYTEDPSFENPDKDYLDIASDYIDALNDRNNTNKFFRGFFDSSFDPLDQSGLPEE